MFIIHIAYGFFDAIVIALSSCVVETVWPTKSKISTQFGDFAGGPMIKTPSSQCRGHRLQSLVKEPRGHMPCGEKKKKVTVWLLGSP